MPLSRHLVASARAARGAASVLNRDAGAIWRRARSRDAKTVGIRVLALVLACYALYLAAANILLGTRLLRDFVSEGPGAELDYASAHSVWPGRVWVSELELQAQDRNIQLEVRMGSAVLDVSLHELFLRRFSALRVAAEGTSFRFRHKLSALGESELRRAAAYPPIEGFLDFPLVEAPPPPGEEQKDLWEIRIEGLNAEFTEIWMQEYRYLGSAVAMGGFWISPGKSFSVLPAHVGLHGGELSMGSRRLAERVELEIQASVKHTDLQALRGLEILRGVKAEVGGAVSGLELSAMALHVPAGSELSFAGQGELRMDASFRDGALEAGGAAELHLREVRVGTPALTGRGELGSTLVVAPDGSVRATARLPRLELETRSRRRAAVAPGATFEVVTSPAPIGALTLERVAASVPDLEVPSLNAWESLLAHGDTLGLRGRLTGELRAAWQRRGGIEADAELRLVGGELTASGVGTRAAGVFELALEPDPTEPMTSLGRLDVDLDSVELNRDGDRSGPFRASLRSSDVRLKGGPDPRLAATLHAVVQPARPMLHLALGSDVLRQLTKMVLDLARLDADMALELSRSELSLELSRARSGSLSGRGHLRRPSNGATSGAFLVASDVGNLGVSIDGSGTDTELLVADDWLARERARPSGAD